MIAAAKGHEKTVKKLMRFGASLVSSSVKVDTKKASEAKTEVVSISERQSTRQNSHRLAKRGSQREERKQEASDAHHEAAISLALRNKYPVIAEMILRDITLKDAVRSDQTQTKMRKQIIQSGSGQNLMSKRALESQSVEPQQKDEPSFNLLPMNIGLNREGKVLCH